MNRDFRDLLCAFSDADVRFLIVGAYAVTFHGRPRFTKDLDLWVEPTLGNAKRVYAALAAFGAPLGDVVIADLTQPRIVFQIGVAPNRIDVLTSVEALDFASAWERRVPATYLDVPVNYLGRSDLILNKRSVGRPQDLIDVNALEDSAGPSSSPSTS